MTSSSCDSLEHVGAVSDSDALLSECEGEEDHQSTDDPTRPSSESDSVHPVGGENGNPFTGCWNDKSDLAVTARRICSGWFFLELRKLFKLSTAISLNILFQVMLLWISLLFLGHLPDGKGKDSYQYAAAGLGSSFLNLTGMSMGNGIATASDTLSSQAYGYKNYKRVGVVLQRGILILGLVLFPIWALFLNTESLLLLVQQTPCVARFSALYVECFILALPFLFLNILLEHYLQSQSIVWQFVLIGLITNVISVVLHAITIHGIGLGFTGAVISLVISNIIPPLLVIGYVWCRKLHKETWGGWSFESLEEWWLYLKLAVPGLLMIALEWSVIEILFFLAGVLGETALSVSIVWYQTLIVFYMPCVGLSIATSIRVGNDLGAGKPQGAQRASYTAISVTFVLSVLFIILLLATKDFLPYAFVPGNEEVAHEASRLIAYVAWIFVIFDQTQIVLGGVLKGSGRQYIGAVTSFVAYYIIGIPVGIVLGFKTDLGVIGLWAGMTIGNAVQCLVFLIVLVRTDWQKESDKAIRRSRGPSGEQPKESRASVNDGEVAMECGPGEEVDTSSLNSQTSSFGSTDGVTVERDTQNLISDVELHNMGEKEGSQIRTSSLHNRRKPSYKIRKLMLHGSFYVVGISILVAGGISSRFNPHVDPEEYSNCTDFSNSSHVMV